ncbi:hypothetical protein JCM17961_06030 [Endothiovibrio diazotrophicus]
MKGRTVAFFGSPFGLLRETALLLAARFFVALDLFTAFTVRPGVARFFFAGWGSGGLDATGRYLLVCISERAHRRG